jgi:hypothetical protein
MQCGEQFFHKDLQMRRHDSHPRVLARRSGVGTPLIATKPLSVAYRGCALIFLKFFWKFGWQIRYKAFSQEVNRADVPP